MPPSSVFVSVSVPVSVRSAGGVMVVVVSCGGGEVVMPQEGEGGETPATSGAEFMSKANIVEKQGTEEGGAFKSHSSEAGNETPPSCSASSPSFHAPPWPGDEDDLLL